MLIVPSTEYRMPLHTCTVVIVQSPVMTPPTWSQLPARAAGARTRSAANRAPRATDQTMRSGRALACRQARLDIRPPSRVKTPGYLMRNATDGHVPLPIRDRFLKRFSDDYPARYVTVLKQENIRILQEVIFYLASEIKEQFQATAVVPVGSASRAPQATEP